MNVAFWRILPGPVWVRILIALTLVAIVLTAIMLWVFPAIDHAIAPQDVTVEE